jgi:phage terminase large subunit-like protein
MEAPLPFEFGMPPRPPGMSPRERKWWDYYTKALYERRVLAKSDQSLILKIIEAKILNDNVAMAEAFQTYETRPEFPEQVEEAQPEEAAKPVREIPNALDSAVVYANDCLSGKIVCGKLVKLACKRFLKDLQETVEFKFSPVAAQHAVDFIHRLGLDLLGWELYCITNIFGFLLPSGLRRFRTALILIARKNGKTGLAASIALYMASPDGDGEKSGSGIGNSNVYIAATSKYQSASLAFKKACELREENPWLACNTKKWKAAITWHGTNSSIEPLASNSERLAGLNVQCAIEDEVGDMLDNGALCSVLESGTVGRRQSLVLAISTAAATREQILYQKRGRAVSVLEGTLPGPELFAYIAELDEGDSPDDESNWPKSNPSLGSPPNGLVPIENLRNEYAAAKVIVSSTRAFYRYNLNLWNATSLTSWLDYRDLEAQGCAYINPEEKDWSPAKRMAAAEERLRMGRFQTFPGDERKIALPDRPCVMGMDLALVDDLSAVILLFPPEQPGGIWEIVSRFFCPEENVERRWRENKIPYTSWRDNSYIISTPGTTTDPDFIRSVILNDLRPRFRITELGFDRAFAESLCKQLEMGGMKVTQVGQGFNLSSSIQVCERLFKEHKLCTWGHPVLNFCLNNVSLRRGYQETVAISKERSKDKVDGASALATAMFIQAHQPVRNTDPNRFRVRVI